MTGIADVLRALSPYERQESAYVDLDLDEEDFNRLVEQAERHDRIVAAGQRMVEAGTSCDRREPCPPDCDHESALRDLERALQ